ncbi:chromosome partitioning protein ParB [Pseudomonas aeruginosa]|uniref:chromosome partitioning protein ParB n=1 Tax=Pseudomonas aeruginosa TaxID=287 RepID=UPI003F51B544
MTGRTGKPRFASRPGDPENWIRAADTLPASKIAGEAFTARLTIDVTPELRGRIKVAAFRRGVTVADMLRDLLAREFPTTEGDPT